MLLVPCPATWVVLELGMVCCLVARCCRFLSYVWLVGCSSIGDFNSVPFKLVDDLGHHQIAVDSLVIM